MHSLTSLKISSHVGPYPFDRLWPLDAAATLACLFEATSPKLGNVHPGAAFADMDYGHFVSSAQAIGPVFARAQASSLASSQASVGSLVLESVKATRESVRRNTNLGTLLLFGPLAIANIRSPIQSWKDWQAATASELAQLTPADSQAIYAAIRHASPGGLGVTEEHDIHQGAPDCLVTAMRVVAERDAVARQYVNNFADIFDRLLPWFEETLRASSDVFAAISELQLRWLAHEPDGHILRKAGNEIASQVQAMAAELVHQENPAKRRRGIAELDGFLRSDGHRRNPGTTADLIAATLLVRLMCGPD